LKKRTLPSVEELDQKHFIFIDNLLQELYRIPDTNPYLRRAKRDGDVRPLIRFIAKCTERTLTEFI
ncbi:unnamed protein product, partial [Rotaria sp. Silwood1]